MIAPPRLAILLFCLLLVFWMPATGLGDSNCCSDDICLPAKSDSQPEVENSLSGFFSHLFDTSSYPPRWNCGQWTSIEGWLHILSDIGIFIAYFMIPAAIVYFISKRKDVPFFSILYLFAAFILCCGATHLIEAIIFYYPIYRIAGLMKLVTAVISLVTVGVLLRLIPKALEIPRIISKNQQLRQADTAKTQFLANMSHEIRTPMTSILGFSDLLLEPNISETERKNAIRTIRRNGRHLLDIINDILDLSKVEAGKIEIEIQPVNPLGLLHETTELFAERAKTEGNSISVSLDGPIPKTIETDPTRLKQALINLIGNAVKFTKKGSVEIIVKHDRDNAQLSFKIIDNGIGISAEQMERIFKPFSQADTSTTRKFGGTGLGLTITKHVAELLGGTVSVESESGKGSTFCLTVAAGSTKDIQSVDSYDQELVGIKNKLKDSKEQKPQIQGTILLVEDGPDNQRLISFVLKKVGADVTIANNGQEGFDAAMEALDAGEPFGLILMDMQMPIMDGYEATERLRENGYPGQIVALTAHAMKGEVQKCLDAGCDVFMSKPIDRKTFVPDVAKRMWLPSAKSDQFCHGPNTEENSLEQIGAQYQI